MLKVGGDDIAGVLVGHNHIVHQTGQQAYNKEGHNDPEPKSEKGLWLVNIIDTMQLSLGAFSHGNTSWLGNGYLLKACFMSCICEYAYRNTP